MPVRTNTPNQIATFNKHGLHLRWPRIWIIILGILLIFFCFAIAGMEVGHTIADLYRSTAFGGFILFIPFLICGIFVLITACKPQLTLLRIATILCFIMIFLCLVLIAYDILVIIDPTRCFFLNCNDAVVNASNSTTNVTVTGWPLTVVLPTYFTTNMTLKRIFQSVQIFCAACFILFAALYILTYFIYRHINLHQKSVYTPDQRTFVKHDTPVITPTKHHSNNNNNNNNNNHIQSIYSVNHSITAYHIEARPATLTKLNLSPGPVTVQTVSPRKSKRRTNIRPRASSVNYDRICTRCMKEPRMVLTSNYERQNFFSHLCVNCNNELLNYRRKPTYAQGSNNRLWKP